MASKPQNHVTRAMALRTAGKEVRLPLLDKEAIETLEAIYAPRCIQKHEALEDHLRYAGQVELVAGLRARLTATYDDDEVDLDESAGEPAR